MKKYIWAILILVVVLGVIGGVKVLQIRELMASGENAGMPPVTVTSALVERDVWERTLSAVGSLRAVQGVTVSAEVPGQVSEIAFRSGSEVGKGDLLVQLDTSTEEAQLQSAEANLELARLELERARTLSETRTISSSELDRVQAQYKEAQAQVRNIESLIGKKTIRAPFAGRLGIRMVNLGEFIPAGNPVVTLQSLDPVHVDFSLPQQSLSKLSGGMPLQVRIDTFPDRVFEGEVTAVSPELERSTRTVALQGTLPNPEGMLYPGMFAKVEVILPERNEVLKVPATSVLYAPYGDSVFLIEEAGESGEAGEGAPGVTGEGVENGGGEATGGGRVIRQKFVRLGESRGDFVSVIEGLEEGDRVVGSGVFKLRNGSAVEVDNSLALDPQSEPTPEEG